MPVVANSGIPAQRARAGKVAWWSCLPYATIGMLVIIMDNIQKCNVNKAYGNLHLHTLVLSPPNCLQFTFLTGFM